MALINASDSAHGFNVKLSPVAIVAACSGSPPQCSTFNVKDYLVINVMSSFFPQDDEGQ